MTNTNARTALGLAGLGRPAYINLGRVAELPAARDVTAMRRATFDVLDRAYAAGIRRVDVARSYGRAEEFLADWITETGHNDLIVSSKWGYSYVGAWRLDADVHEVKEHTLARFAEQWQQTRDLLADRVALYQVHSLTAESDLFHDPPLLAALTELGASGVRVGFSTSGPGQADTIRRALELEVEGRRVFHAVQATWNVLETSAAPALREAHAAGVWVQLKETLANGRLAVSPPEALTERAAARGVSPAAMALAAAYAQPWADVMLIGPVSPDQLADDLTGATMNLDQADLATLHTLGEPPEDYWAERGALEWR